MKWHQLPAFLAEQMMVMGPGGVDQLVPRDPITHVEPVHKTVLLQQLEYAVHARPPHGALATLTASERVLDLQRAQSAVLAREQLDHLVARRALVMAGLLQHVSRVCSPVRPGLHSHRAKDSSLADGRPRSIKLEVSR